MSNEDFDIKSWIRKEMLFMMQWELDMVYHEQYWGVPCGPTLTMVNPPQPLKIITTSHTYSKAEADDMWARVRKNLNDIEQHDRYYTPYFVETSEFESNDPETWPKTFPLHDQNPKHDDQFRHLYEARDIWKDK